MFLEVWHLGAQVMDEAQTQEVQQTHQTEEKPEDPLT